MPVQPDEPRADDPVEMPRAPAKKKGPDLATVDKALERLQQQVQSDEVDPKLLKDLGWTPEQALGFAERYRERIRQVVQPKPGAPAKQAKKQVKPSQKQDRRVLQGQGVSRRVRDSVGKHRSVQDRVNKLHESRRSEPPPEYRRRWKYYTKGLSEPSEPSRKSDK